MTRARGREASVPADDLVLHTGERVAVLVPDPTRPRAFTLRVGRTDQSYVDLDDPLRLDFDYVQRFADVLDVLAPPGARLSVVHVGGAALTVPRYVAATRPQSAQVVLEPDAELTAFVRRHLPLPRQSGIRVRDVDGRTGIAALRDGQADVVVLDAFDGARVPPELVSVEYFAQLRRVVGPRGTVLVNLTDRGPFTWSRRVVAGLRSTFAQVVFAAEPSTMRGRRFGNVVLTASDAALPVDEIARRANRPPFPYRVLHDSRLEQLLGAARPFTGADVEPSPEPPPDLLFG